MGYKKKIAIFDLDGTLIDAYDSIYKTIDFICEKINCEKFDYERVKRAVGGGDLKLICNLFDKDKIEVAHKLYREYYLNFLKGNVKLMRGCIEILSQLKEKKLKIAVATNRSNFCLDFLLKESGIKNFFDIILCADDVENPKPHPEIILKILEKTGFKKEETFYVGDMDIDYETGKNAGVDTFIVLTGSCRKEDFLEYKNPLIFEDLIQLKKFLIENILI
ncbi:MAG TPA: HAD family hydrolase [bacterium]|nr:HAD family hydrolase [bacterium]HOM27002.1 HAD family hydrolase [bacterium]